MPNQTSKPPKLVLFRLSDIFIFAGSALVLLVVANIAWVFPILDEVEQGAYSLLKARGVTITEKLNTFLEHDTEDLRNGALLINRNLTEPESVVIRLLRENRSYDALILLDSEGREAFIKQNRFVIESGILSDAIFETVEKGDIYISELLFNKINQPTIEYAIPLQKETGYSAIVGQLNLKFFIDEIFEGIRINEGSAVYIVDRNGYLIGHTTWQLVVDRTQVSDRKLVAYALEGKEVDTRNESLIYINENGDEVFATALPIGHTGWALIIEETQDPALAAAQRTITVAVISFGFQVLLLLFILFIYFRLTKAARLFFEERNQREAIMNNLIDGIIVSDEFSKIILMNPPAENLLGVKLEEIGDLVITPSILKQKPKFAALVEVMYPETAPYTSNSQRLFGGRATIMNIDISKPKRSLEMTMLHILDQEGGSIGFLKILHDLTREQLVEKRKMEFISIAAHQLRTPLSKIKWSLGRILDGDEGKLTKSQEVLLKESYKTGESMIDLLKGLLDAVRIEEGEYFHKPVLRDVGDVVRDTVESVEELAKNRNVILTFNKEEGLPEISIDSESMSVAIQNIVENAIHYTPTGGKVTISVKHVDSNIEIIIKDTGIGIPKEDYPRIFTKFYRAKNALLLETEGSGLGLFIAQNIIQAHGGKIWFESEEKKGSTFYVTIPIGKKT